GKALLANMEHQALQVEDAVGDVPQQFRTVPPAALGLEDVEVMAVKPRRGLGQAVAVAQLRQLADQRGKGIRLVVAEVTLTVEALQQGVKPADAAVHLADEAVEILALALEDD